VARREIEAMHPLLTAEVNLYPAIGRASVARERLGMMLLVSFGVMAVGLAAVGIYGLMSHTVTQRAGEVAVRVALGAIALRQVVANQWYGVNAVDPVIFLLVPVTLLFVATLACLLPARRAARMDPADLLRSERLR
jgi:ABC-type antimicrobial peptide transport system permease subunit